MSFQGAGHRNIVQLGKYYGALHLHYFFGGFVSTNITGALHLLSPTNFRLNKSKKDLDQSLKPFTQEELIERAKKSNSDYLAGKFKTQEQLEIESKNW